MEYDLSSARPAWCVGSEPPLFSPIGSSQPARVRCLPSMLVSAFGPPYRRVCMSTIVDVEKCNACGDCVDACPLDAIEMKDGKAAIDGETCGDCGACVDVCPSEAISIE